MDLSKCHLHYGMSKHKGKTYKSYSLAIAVRENGKNRKVIVKPLGKLSEAEVRTWKRTLDFAKTGADPFYTHVDDVRVESNYSYLDIAVALEIWNSWRLNEVFKRDGNHEVPLHVVAATLTINRCIDPSSNIQIPCWFKDTALPFLLQIDPDKMNASRIFRELDAIEARKEKICDHIYQTILKSDPDSLKSVFYDLSSTTFSGTKCILMKWGHCKEGYENHIVLALVVNNKGFPIYWNVLAGGTNDATTIEWLTKELKEKFKLGDITLVFDRGMVSGDNLALLEAQGIKYISAMDKNQLEGISKINFSDFFGTSTDEVLQKLINSQQFLKLNENTYYHEIKPIGNQRYLLCFNPQLYSDQKNAREESVHSFAQFVKRTNGQLRGAEKSRNERPTLKKFTDELTRLNLQSFVKVSLKQRRLGRETPKGYRKVTTFECIYEVDEAKRLQAGRLDGFWMAVTNHTDKTNKPAPEIINPYRDKVEIEWSFRDIKSFIEISPVRVWTIEHVKAHYTICVLAHLLNRTLMQTLREKKGSCSKEIVSHIELFKKLGTCELNKLSMGDMKKIRWHLTRPTDVQEDLLDRLGFGGLINGSFAQLKNTLAKVN